MKHARPITLLAALAALLTIAPVSAQNFGNLNLSKVLDIGKKAVEANREISEPEEIQIGNGIAANLLGAAPLVRDDGLQHYVNRVGRWLALQTERPDLPWRFGVIDSPDVNAFAMPGGTILITRGLYLRLRDEAELAGVLAHEISHVLQKHQLKAIKSALGKQWTSELAGEVIDRRGGQYSQQVKKAFSAGTEIMARGLDKNDEYQADHLGVVIATRAGYNPFGLVGVLQTLDAISPTDSGMALMFKTHPSAASRIELLSGKLGYQFDAYADTGKSPARLYALK